MMPVEIEGIMSKFVAIIKKMQQIKMNYSKKVLAKCVVFVYNRNAVYFLMKNKEM